MPRMLALCAIAFLAFGFEGAHAESVSDFYAGRQIHAVVGNPAGGDYDNWMRLIARHWGDFIPGHPTFLIENRPGAGQIIATNYLYNEAPRDGSVVGLTERTLPYLKRTGRPNLRFDPTKFNWIGSPESSHRICVDMAGAPVKSAQDLFSKQLLVGGAGAGTAVSNTPMLLAKLLGMKFKVVEGYGSAESIVLAMERGEVQGICQTLAGVESIRPGWIENGKLRVLFSMERSAVPGLHAPTIYRFAKTPEQQAIIRFFDSSIELGRPLIAPPGVPQERVAALRLSFNKMMADPSFQADAARLGYHLTLTKGEDLQNTVEQIMNAPDSLVSRVRRLTQ